MVVFEIFRGSWAGCAFWRQCTEATTSFLSLMSTTRYWTKSSNASVSLDWFEPAETPVQEILDGLKQSKWLNNLCPKSCEGKWCISEDSQQWWQPFFSRAAGGTVCTSLLWSWQTTIFSSERERQLGRRDPQWTVTNIGPIFFEEQSSGPGWCCRSPRHEHRWQNARAAL